MKTMNLTIAPKDLLQIDNARIIFRNFSGEASKYNSKGERNFSLLIDSEEIADMLLDNKNKYGDSWNVKSKPPREEGDMPFIWLPVKVKFNDNGPHIYLRSGRNRVKLDEESIACLDDIEIENVDLDIRPYDNEVNGKTYRSAYLQSMEVTQRIDRFTARHMEDDYE